MKVRVSIAEVHYRIVNVEIEYTQDLYDVERKAYAKALSSVVGDETFLEYVQIMDTNHWCFKIIEKFTERKESDDVSTSTEK